MRFSPVSAGGNWFPPNLFLKIPAQIICAGMVWLIVVGQDVDGAQIGLINI